jgi:hypothetical protein
LGRSHHLAGQQAAVGQDHEFAHEA